MTLERLKLDIKVKAFTDKIVEENVDKLVGDADIILDCMDNFPTRYLLNESAIREKIPLVYGSIWGIDGRLSFIQSPETPCLRCILTEQGGHPRTWRCAGCDRISSGTGGVKYLVGIGTTIKGQLLVWEGGTTDFQKFKIRKDPDCPTCREK